MNNYNNRYVMREFRINFCSYCTYLCHISYDFTSSIVLDVPRFHSYILTAYRSRRYLDNEFSTHDVPDFDPTKEQLQL